MRSIKIAVLIVIFILGTVSYGFGLGLEVSSGVWNQDPSGYISYKGNSINVEDELRYSKENRFFGRVKLETPLFFPNIYFMYTPMRFKADGQKTVNFKFGNVTFNGNIPFHSNVELDHYDFALYYGLPFIKKATLNKLNIDVGLNIRVVDFYAKIEQQATNLSEKKDATIPIPMVYVGVQLKPVKFFHIEGELRGVAYNGSSYFDVIGRAKLYPFCTLFFVSLGYRLEDINIDYADVDSEVRISGPFLEVGLTF